MFGFLLRWAIAALGLWLAAKIVPGLAFDSGGTLLAAALLLGLVNAFVRPFVILLTLPVTVLTLGLFLLVVNAGMLALVAALLEGFRISGFGAALAGSIIVGLTSWIASWYVGPRGQVEVLVVRQ